MKKEQKQLPRFRFMAMSKLIGIIAFLFVFMVVVYAMYEMHISQSYDSLPQLIISVFGFASVYAGFYLTMAKVEHVEEEKTKREKELMTLIQSSKTTPETLEAKRQEINDLFAQANNLLNEMHNDLL